MSVLFKDFPADSRIWIFPFSGKIQNPTEVQKNLNQYLASWNSHGTPLHAQSEILEGLFIIVAVNKNYASASGCSIDGLFSQIKNIADQFNMVKPPLGDVFYRSNSGSITCSSRSSFSKLYSENIINEDTIVFDTTLETLGQLTSGAFAKPLKKSWHFQIV